MSRISRDAPAPTVQERVQEFIRVARRIGAHPVVRDEDLTVKLAGHPMTINFAANPGEGGAPVRIDSFGLIRVDEVVLESWALRTRRLEARSDPVYFPSVMKVAKSLVNKNGAEPSPLADKFDEIRKKWNDFQKTPPVIMGMANLQTGEEQSASSLELVDAWRNGHMFHGDAEKKDRPDLMTHNELVLEVGHHVALVSVYAMQALSLMSHCYDQGILPIDSSCFTDQVVYDEESKVMAGFAKVSVAGPRVEMTESDEGS